MTERTHREYLVYIGTYTGGKSEGIYVYSMNPSSGALEYVATTTNIKNPSFLAIAPNERFLYAVNEVADFNGNRSGAVSAYALNPSTGALTYLNQQASVGVGPCHLCVDKTGKCVVVANYGSGSVAMLPIREDGTLGEASDFIQHQGSGANPQRQEGPHAHSVTLDPANRYAFVADLGLDKILVYKLDLAQGKLVPNDIPWTLVHPGAGPRHFAFHPNGRHAYVINELDSTMTAFQYHASVGGLREIQSLSTLPEGFDGTSYCADAHVSPSGKFLYGSNRGHDSIAIFAIDGRTGRLTPVGHESTQGKTPRNFAMDPSGTFLLAANQDSDTIVTFKIDGDTGRLAPTGHVAEVPRPVCLKFVRRV